jgi:uncharacterized protein (DUF2126 family)
MVDGRRNYWRRNRNARAENRRQTTLRRIDLLRSLITFTTSTVCFIVKGPFIGPVAYNARWSGRDENYKNCAFDPKDKEVPLMVDRIFRNLLTGLLRKHTEPNFVLINYIRQISSTIIGYLELRAFDIRTKHMNLVQNLLVRALVAKFKRTIWEKTYSLGNWASFLRAILPHVQWWVTGEDLVELIISVNFIIHFWRFPHQKNAYRSPVSPIRYRTWHVLGEAFCTGTPRFVDSSLERLQVKVSGIVPDRHIMQGCRIPLSTGTKGEYVAGIQLKAWIHHPGHPNHWYSTYL